MPRSADRPDVANGPRWRAAAGAGFRFLRLIGTYFALLALVAVAIVGLEIVAGWFGYELGNRPFTRYLVFGVYLAIAMVAFRRSKK